VSTGYPDQLRMAFTATHEVTTRSCPTLRGAEEK
jgi:hypothetical protein